MPRLADADGREGREQDPRSPEEGPQAAARGAGCRVAVRAARRPDRAGGRVAVPCGGGNAPGRRETAERVAPPRRRGVHGTPRRHAERREARAPAHERVDAELVPRRHHHAHHRPVHVRMVVADQVEVPRREAVQEVVRRLVAVDLREDEGDLRLPGQRLRGLEGLVRHPDRAAVRVAAAQVERVLQVEEHEDARRRAERRPQARDLLRVRLRPLAERHRVRLVVRVQEREAVDLARVVEDLERALVRPVLLDAPGHLAHVRRLPREAVPREVLRRDRREVVGAAVHRTQVPARLLLPRERPRQRHRERGLARPLDPQEQRLRHVRHASCPFSAAAASSTSQPGSSIRFARMRAT